MVGWDTFILALIVALCIFGVGYAIGATVAGDEPKPPATIERGHLPSAEPDVTEDDTVEVEAINPFKYRR